MPAWTRTPSQSLGAISALKPGRALSKRREDYGGKRWDYSHLLTVEQRAEGFKLWVRSAAAGDHLLRADVYNAKAPPNPRFGKGFIGGIGGILDGAVLNVSDVQLDAKFRGKGFGRAVYEALYRQAQLQGATRVSGRAHSTLAKFVHESLARRHGVVYRPVPNDEAHGGDWPQRDWDRLEKHPSEWPLDERWKAYEYALTGVR